MAPEEESLAAASDKRILIADDEPAILSYLQMILTQEGFRIETAADGQEALQKIQQNAPDLLLLDLKLPKVQGLEVVRELQASDASRMPIFIITGHMANRETEAMVKQEPNVKGYYAKPLNARLLAMNIHTLLRTKPVTSGKSLGW